MTWFARTSHSFRRALWRCPTSLLGSSLRLQQSAMPQVSMQRTAVKMSTMCSWLCSTDGRASSLVTARWKWETWQRHGRMPPSAGVIPLLCLDPVGEPQRSRQPCTSRKHSTRLPWLSLPGQWRRHVLKPGPGRPSSVLSLRVVSRAPALGPTMPSSSQASTLQKQTSWSSGAMPSRLWPMRCEMSSRHGLISVPLTCPEPRPDQRFQQ
mmetsp:Transcript_40443/g.95104  ORF Transcript_40443/g.95104 Transcript_40443/m.95104 type:complete len:209 (+) Transcript_40443:1023-1649(+)